MSRRQRRRRAAATTAARAETRTVMRAGPRPLGAATAGRLRGFARRRPATVVAVLVAVHVVLALLTFLPQPHTGGDNAAYITLGRSLVTNGTYTELWDPAEPPHTKYPPTFPAVLGIAMSAGLAPWVRLKFVVLAFSATAVAFTFLWIRARGRPLLALGIGALIALAPGVLREGRWILSDVPFWALTMMAVWAFERLRPDDWKRFAIAAAATLLAYFTRSAGLPLVLAALAWLSWRRQWKQFGALAVIIGVPALLWWLRSSAYGPSGYVSEFWLVDPYAPAHGRIGASDLFVRVFTNGGRYLSIHMPILLAGRVGSLLTAISAVVLLLAAVGWIRRLRRSRVSDIFVPLYVGLILVWPAVWSGERFLLPILPMLLLLAGEAMARMLGAWAPRVSFAVPASAFALVAALALPGLLEARAFGRECTARYRAGDPYPCLGPYWSEFFDLATTIRHMLPDDAVTLNRKPRLFFALGGTQGRNYPLSDDPAAFFATADSAGARYLVFDRLDGVSDFYARPVLLRRPDAFCLMRTDRGGTTLFGIRPDYHLARDRGRAAVDGGEPVSFELCGAGYWRSEEAARIYSGRP